MKIWDDPDEEWHAPPNDWLAAPRAFIRLAILLTSLLLCIIPFVTIRYGQRLFGYRHNELFLLKVWGKIAIWCFGLSAKVEGNIQIDGGLITSNHINFIDIPVLFSIVPGYMISKYEVKHWFFIGWCARILGTEFVKRDPVETSRQVASLTKRIDRGDRMIIFPEATTTDGQRIIPFRSSFFQAVAHIDDAYVQPISLYYHAPKNASRNFYGYWGEARLLPRMWAVFSSKGRQTLDIVINNPLPTELGRKALAVQVEEETRKSFTKLQESA